MCQKTVTIDFFTHKSVKNNGLEPQYFIEGHHPAIIEKSEWLLAQQIRRERRYAKRRAKLRLHYVIKGPLAGFMITNIHWTEEDAESILARVLEKPDKSSISALAEDENFMIEKEYLK